MTRSRLTRVVSGVTLLVFVFFLIYYVEEHPSQTVQELIKAGLYLGISVALLFLVLGDRLRLKEFSIGPAKWSIVDPRPPIHVKPPDRDPQEFDEYKARADTYTQVLTRVDSPPFTLTSDALGSGAIPTGDQFTPTYILDAQYRIVDWNEAFAVLFNNTMDGLRGNLISDWIFYLENDDEVLSKANDFVDEAALPNPHLDDFIFVSSRYGKLKATKKAFKIPKAGSGNDAATEDLLGWVAVLDVEFEDRVKQDMYSRELINALRWDLVWSEYAICYDAVLMQTETYPKLISSIIGTSGVANPIPDNAKVLDLGAGTGNVSAKLMESANRRILAVEKNRTSLAILRDKVKDHLVPDIAKEAGVQVIPQDIRSLRGLPEDFDVILLNNVLYTIDDPLALLRDARRHLTSEGEIRITGPMKSTDLEKLFAIFRKELISSKRFEEIASHYELAYEINRRYLTQILFRHTVDDIVALVREAGFTEVVSDTVYGGQAYLVCAKIG